MARKCRLPRTPSVEGVWGSCRSVWQVANCTWCQFPCMSPPPGLSPTKPLARDSNGNWSRGIPTRNGCLGNFWRSLCRRSQGRKSDRLLEGKGCSQRTRPRRMLTRRRPRCIRVHIHFRRTMPRTTHRGTTWRTFSLCTSCHTPGRHIRRRTTCCCTIPRSFLPRIAWRTKRRRKAARSKRLHCTLRRIWSLCTSCRSCCPCIQTRTRRPRTARHTLDRRTCRRTCLLCNRPHTQHHGRTRRT